jgi:eukaryotic-like serine/threonine-protein kinase
MMSDHDFESRILSFERAWQLDGPREIADFLGGVRALESEEPRRRLLVELICIDLEFRWRDVPRNRRTQEPILLDGYVAKFPELGPLDGLPLELIGEEYRVRHRWGDRPAHSEFLSRFQERREPIRSELLRIDGQLREESSGVGNRPRPEPTTTPSDVSPGRIIDGPLLSHKDFLLERMIGAGRIGKVYQAWQPIARRAVAVKFLRKSFLDQPRVVRRFIDEAGTIARMRHPNIVGIHGLGRTPAGSYFIAMDLVAGPDLALLGRARPIAVAEVLHWAIETCEALEHAHARGIIHCDLKPANLVLDGDGSIRVTDFGLARSLNEEMKWTAEVEGTAPFMAPEQVSRYYGEIDVRTDVYGIGATLFTLLTGRLPWVGRRLPDILADVISAAPAISPTCLRPDLPESLAALCGKCLSKLPDARYQTVHEVRWILTELIGQ